MFIPFSLFTLSLFVYTINRETKNFTNVWRGISPSLVWSSSYVQRNPTREGYITELNGFMKTLQKKIPKELINTEVDVI